MLLYTPIYLFFIPGGLLFSIGVVVMLWLSSGSREIGQYVFFIHPLFFASTAVIVGYQVIFFGLFANTFSHHHLKHEPGVVGKINKYLTIEKAGAVGLTLSLLGMSLFIYVFNTWLRFSSGQFDQINNSIIALTLVVLGVQTIFSSFMISLLGINKK